MTKEAWIEHMESACGCERPSRGGSLSTWKDMIAYHKQMGCQECQDRGKTKRATQNRKDREDAYRLAGLVKVKGALGGIYWE